MKTSAADKVIASSLKRVNDKTALADQGKRRKKTAKEDSTHNLANEAVHDSNSSARQADARTRISRDSDLPTEWKRPSSLLAPPARPGYVNRWVRFRSGNDEDRDNLDKFMSQGWRPIPKSSIRKDHPLTANLEGKYGQYVVKRGLLLMELPENLWQQRQDFYADKQIRMTESIDRNLKQNLDRRTPGWGNEHRSTVTKSARRGRLDDRVPGDE